MPIKAKAFITFAHTFKFNTNGVRFLHMYSTNTTSAAGQNHFLVNYLVDSLGFSREEAITTSANKVISRKKNPKDPDSVLNAFKQAGVDENQLKELILKAPLFLYYNNVNRTLMPKFYWLKEIGLSISDSVSIIAKDKQILGRSLDNHLRSRFSLLGSILGSDENAVKIIRRCSWLLGFGNNRSLMGNVTLLQDFGMSNEQIKKLVLRQPSYITQNRNRVMDVLRMVEEGFGVLRSSGMFVYAVDVVFSVSNSKLKEKMKVFESFGWSDTDVVKLFGKMPYCFNLSEARIEKGLSFFMKDLGCSPAFLSSNPALLAYSLEKRVLPRLQVFKILEEHGKLSTRNVSFFTTLYLSKSKFIESFVLPYEDQIPSLCEPLKKTASQ